MRFTSSLAIFIFAVAAAAGGIRGGYERIFVWFAYQSEIEYLKKRDGNLNALQICGSEYGTGPDKTLLFNEFIDWTNTKKGQGRKQEAPVVLRKGETLQIDAMAKRLLAGSKTKPQLMNPRWEAPNNIINSAAGSYDKMMVEVAKVLHQASGTLGPNNINVKSAVESIEKVVISRQIDYEKYRMPLMQAAPEFNGRVRFMTWNLQLAGEPNAKRLDLQWTIRANPTERDIGKRVEDWEKNTYFASTDVDPSSNPPRTLGATRSSHKHAVVGAQKAENMAKTGKC